MALNDALLFFALKAGMFPVDDAVDSVDPSITYNSFADREGNFYIMKIFPNANGGSSYRFKVFDNESDYATVWAARESLDYEYPWEVF